MFKATNLLKLSAERHGNVPILSFGEFKTIRERVEAIERAISLYGSFPAVSISSHAKMGTCPPMLGNKSGRVILVTGTTGNLGSRILLDLLKDERVKTVYAVNQPSERMKIMERHVERFEDSGLDKQPLSSPKVVFIETDVSEERMGLGSALYETVDTIIHIAWRLDLVAPLSTFEPNIRATRNLIDLGRTSPLFHGPTEKRLKFILTSSISSTYGWDRIIGPYPEEIVFDAEYGVGMGYGESKYVAERILGSSGLNATSLRIDQCCGGLPNGAWPVVEWYPALIQSSIAMGMAPSAEGIVHFIPADAAANAILDLVWCSQVFPPAMNVVNPYPIAWNHLIELTLGALVAQNVIQGPLPLIPFSEWAEKLGRVAKTATVVKRLRALKLIELWKNIADYNIYLQSISLPDSCAKFHFAGFPHFETSKIRQLSQTMRGLEPIEKKDVEQWVKYWLDVGFFDDAGVIVDKVHLLARL